VVVRLLNRAIQLRCRIRREKAAIFLRTAITTVESILTKRDTIYSLRLGNVIISGYTEGEDICCNKKLSILCCKKTKTLVIRNLVVTMHHCGPENVQKIIFISFSRQKLFIVAVSVDGNIM